MLSYPEILISFFLSFTIVFCFMPHWIKRAKNAGLSGKDMHKTDGRRVAEAGGVIVIFGFLIGTLAYIAIDTFWIKHANNATSLARDLEMMAALVSILVVSILGIADDILGWKIGLRQIFKPFLALIAALPIMVLNAGQSTMALPFIGQIDLKLIYPLLVIPIAISGASNGFNMLAGYNGLEAGMGAIILSALAYLSWAHHIPHVAVMALCMVFALLAFLWYNKYPAKVFPGNVMTYAVGAMIAIVAIAGNNERAAVILFIPYFIEFALKARGKMKKESFAKVNVDGSLEVPYEKIYGLEHLAIKVLKNFKRKVYEKDVVYSLLAVEMTLVILLFGLMGIRW